MHCGEREDAGIEKGLWVFALRIDPSEVTLERFVGLIEALRFIS